MNTFVQASCAIRCLQSMSVFGSGVSEARPCRDKPKVAKPRFLVNLSMAAAAAFSVLTSTPARAIDYSITFDTSSIAGTAGEVDFQWNLGVVDPSLTAKVSSFSGTALSDPATLLDGDIGGSLGPGGSLQFAGTEAFNWIYQTLSFGPSISFTLSLPDTAPLQSVGSNASVFAVSLFDAALAPALPTLPSAFNNASLVFSLAPGEGPVLMQYTDAAVNVVSPVPEPETYALLLAGLGMIAFIRRRSQTRR